MKKLPLVILMALLVSTVACTATVEQNDFLALQSQVIRNQRLLKEMNKKLESNRRPMADTRAELSALRQDLARLRGQVEETGHRLGQMPDAGSISQRLADQAAKDRIEIDKRLKRLEDYLGIKDGQAPAKPAKPKDKPDKPAQVKPKTDKDIYDLGRRLYKQKSYQASRDRFSEMLKRFPKSKLAAAAQYWVGETYYAQRKYEEAILAFNRVVKSHRKSSKAPPALLKQGMAFRALGDKRTARIVLNKLVKSYPKSSAAKTAKKILRKLK